MYLKVRYFTRFLKAFIKKFKGLILISIPVGILFFLILNLVISKYYFYQTDKIGMIGRYPADNLPDEITQLISEGLTKINDKNEVEPSLATSWETPDKGKTWVFKLRDNLFWQDGSVVTSSDIKYSFSDVSYSYPDKNTIVFILKDRFAPFPYVVSSSVFKKGLLGTGSWKVSKLTLSASYVSQLEIINNKQKRVYKFYPTEETAKLALKLGKVNTLKGLFDLKPFNSWNTVKVENTNNYNQIVTIFLNNKDPLLKDKTFRQALNYAIDKSEFSEVRAISPISPYSWAYNPQVKQYAFDPTKIKDFKKTFEIKLTTTPTLLSKAELIAKNWNEVGVKTTILVSPIIPTDFQAYLTIFDLPADPDQYSIWHSTQQESNISKYSNPRIDKLLEDGRAEISTTERKKYYLDFQRFLVEDTPAIFLYHPVTYNVERK